MRFPLGAKVQVLQVSYLFAFLFFLFGLIGNLFLVTHPILGCLYTIHGWCCYCSSRTSAMFIITQKYPITLLHCVSLTKRVVSLWCNMTLSLHSHWVLLWLHALHWHVSKPSGEYDGSWVFCLTRQRFLWKKHWLWENTESRCQLQYDTKLFVLNDCLIFFLFWNDASVCSSKA